MLILNNLLVKFFFKQKMFKIKSLNPDEDERILFSVIKFDCFKDFADNKIPNQTQLRSEYIHKANVLIEEHANKNKLDCTVENLTKISNHWRKYSIWNRKNLDKEHKTALFCIRTRIDFILSKIQDPKDIPEYAMEKEDLQNDTLREYLKSKDSISQYTVYTFIRSIRLLLEKFYELRYSPILKRHLKRLYLRCGRFMMFRSQSNKIFNDPIYCMLDQQTGFYSIKKYFIEKHDCIFHEIELKFEIFENLIGNDLSVNTNDLQYSFTQRKTLLNWLFDQVKGPFLDPTERYIQKFLFSLHVNPGELELFIQEDKHSEPTPYNLMAKFRRSHFDDLADVFESTTPLNDIIQKYLTIFDKIENKNKQDKMEIEIQQNKTSLNIDENQSINIYDMFNGDYSNHSILPELEIKTHNKMQHKSDIDLIAISIPMISYAFDKNYMGSEHFYDKMIILEDSMYEEEEFQKVVQMKTKQKPGDLPIFIQMFNEFFLLYQGVFFRAAEFLSLYLEWVRLCSEDVKINAKPYGSVNLLEQYKLFFPERIESYQKLETNHNQMKIEFEDKFGLPTVYTDKNNRNIKTLYTANIDNNKFF